MKNFKCCLVCECGLSLGSIVKNGLDFSNSKIENIKCIDNKELEITIKCTYCRSINEFKIFLSEIS